MKRRRQRKRSINRMRDICFAFLLILGVGLVLTPGVQAAAFYDPSVPIIIHNQDEDSSEWTIGNITSYGDYIFGYDDEGLIEGSYVDVYEFDNGVYDFWLLDNDTMEKLYLSKGDATLIFKGNEFTAGDGTTYYSQFIISWILPNDPSVDFDLTISATATPNVGAAPVPIPATVFLLGSGIVGLIALSRRRRP